MRRLENEEMDAHYRVPLAGIIRPANEHDTTLVKPALALLKRIHPQIKPKSFMGDRGYESLNNFEHLVAQKITPIIAVPKPTAEEELYDGPLQRPRLPNLHGTDADGIRRIRPRHGPQV